MSLEIEVRYLTIDWQSEGIARAIEVSQVPLELELRTGGNFAVESTIFNGFHPWLGIHLGPVYEDVVPVFVTALGQKTPMVRISCPRGGGFWWLQNDGWDQAGKRHLSELQRSPGIYKVLIGDAMLQIENRLSAFGRADIQSYVDEFRGDLLWMIMNDAAGATASGKGAGAGTELVEALEDLHNASQRVLASPALIIREGQASQPIARMRPNTASFREYARNPAARKLTGRVFDESADTAENRYLRHILAVSLKVADAYVSAASLQTGFLERLALQESDRARRNRDMDMRPVDPEVFDQQTGEINRKLDDLAAFSIQPENEESRIGWFPIRLGPTYHSRFSLYYEPQEAKAGEAESNIDYRVAVLPESFFQLILGTLHFCRNFTIKGGVDSSVVSTKTGKIFRNLEFISVHKVMPQTDVLQKRAAKRQGLEKNDWLVRLSSNERRELKREADTGERRVQQSLMKKVEVASSVSRVVRVARRLKVIDDDFNRMEIQNSATFPTGMRFVSNPHYAACLSAFNRVRAFFERGGLDLSKLEQISNIGILHVSDIYEKWCMLKIIMLLMHDFKFEPERGWEEKLISTSIARACNTRFEFSREDLEMKVLLICQAEMPSGRRPDFVLEISYTGKQQSRRLNHETELLGSIVMDAKFRSSWKNNELNHMLDELVIAKGYDKAVESGRVFILQPSESTARPAASPLEWGSHCNYGGLQSHRQGWIQTGVTASGAHSTQHLKRLLSLVFQNAFPEPQEGRDEQHNDIWTSCSFCLGCGGRHMSEAIKGKKTKSGATMWLLDCKQCGVWTSRTHCYNCKASLFKNGTLWTYHNTIADQVTNVICPGCGSYFDANFS